MSSDHTPRRRKYSRKRAPKEELPIRMTDVDFVLFLANEETEREGDALYEKSAPIFMTYIEERKELTDGSDFSYPPDAVTDEETVTIFDVYIGIDCTYRSIGKFTNLEDAKAAAASIRLRLERRMKTSLRKLFGLHKPWIPPKPET